MQMMESLETDVFTNASCSNTSVTESQKKKKNVKKTLIYDLDDEVIDATSGFDDDGTQWKTASRKNALSEDRSNETEIIKIQDSYSVDCEESNEASSSTHFESCNSKEKNCSNENSCDEKVHQPSLQEESLNICGANATNENREVSAESNSSASQSCNGAATPENNFNILERVFTESIKKSHKKIKHENRKALFKSLHEQESTTELGITTQDTYNNDQCEDIKNKTTDAVYTPRSQNSNRPSTPENINSSRLLLPSFNSIKKSHKKDKLGKKVYNFSKSYKDLTNTNKISSRNKSLRLKESPDILGSNKRKKSKDISLQSDTCKSPSWECRESSDEFKIYTPIKNVSSSLFTSCIYTDKTQEDSIQMTSTEINCSRCITPVICYSKKLKESNDSISEECADVCVSKDEPARTINLKNKNGRSTPIHMSTTELLDDVNSIKKSHKKDKHDRSVHKRRVLRKKLYTEQLHKENRSGNVANNVKVLEEHTSLPFKSLNVDNYSAEMEIYSDILDEKQNKSNTVQDSPQPSTSQANENGTNMEKSKLLSTTPSNDVNAANFVKVLHATSIKKSHRKERDDNAQAKYILMSEEHELSDDGSIFNDDDRLNFIESYGLRQDSDDEMIN